MDFSKLENFENLQMAPIYSWKLHFHFTAYVITKS